MKRYISVIFITIITLPASVCLFASCSGKGAGESDTLQDVATHLADSLPRSIHILTQAVDHNKPEQFAAIVSYPLERPYPLKSIGSKEEMVKYYATLVDDSLRDVIVKSKDKSWSEEGWRGWTLYEGQYVWVDDSLYQVSYVSKAERKEMKRLLERDSLSMAPGLRKGWQPVACMKSANHGTVYRIDRNPRARHGKAYRLAVWEAKDSLSGNPTFTFSGQRHEEGTAGTVTYFFAAPNGAKAVYAADITDLYDRPRVLFTYPDGTAVTDTVTSAYWLDLIDNK